MGAADSKNAKLWKGVLDEMASETAEVQKKVIQTIQDDIKERKQPDETKIKEMADEFAKKYEEDHLKMFSKIFKAYDANGDGCLDLAECKALMKESLKGQKEYIPEQVENLVNATVKSGIEIARMMNVNSELLEIDTKAIKKKAITGMTDVLDSMIKDSDTLAEKLFEKMDANKDGKVTNQEFMDNYRKASAELANMSEVMATMEKAMSG